MGEQQRRSLSYRDAGVDIDAADAALKRVKESIKKTFDANVVRDIGSFGAMYRFDPAGMKEPILVSSTDGVGTKLKLAFMTGKHNTVGIDLVSHCVNDILVQAAKPMFFLDYLACGKMDPDTIASVIEGVAAGCRYAACSLIGGETAEMPGMYAPGEYDLAGTIVGVVDREKIIDGSAIQPGDAVIGLESSGLHTNGYSLARKICFEVAELTVSDPMPGTGQNVGDALLEPHKSYSRVIQVVSRIVKIRGMAHITGGGITDGLGAEIDLAAWKLPPIFSFLQREGNVEPSEMLRSFNCGMGYLVVVAAGDEQKTLKAFEQIAEPARVIGRVIEGQGVSYKGTLEHA